MPKQDQVWSESERRQIESRFCRPPSTKNVTVIDILCRGSIDEHMFRTSKEKGMILSSFFGESNPETDLAKAYEEVRAQFPDWQRDRSWEQFLDHWRAAQHGNMEDIVTDARSTLPRSKSSSRSASRPAPDATSTIMSDALLFAEHLRYNPDSLATNKSIFAANPILADIEQFGDIDASKGPKGEKLIDDEALEDNGDGDEDNGDGEEDNDAHGDGVGGDDDNPLGIVLSEPGSQSDRTTAEDSDSNATDEGDALDDGPTQLQRSPAVPSTSKAAIGGVAARIPPEWQHSQDVDANMGDQQQEDDEEEHQQLQRVLQQSFEEARAQMEQDDMQALHGSFNDAEEARLAELERMEMELDPDANDSPRQDAPPAPLAQRLGGKMPQMLDLTQWRLDRKRQQETAEVDDEDFSMDLDPTALGKKLHFISSMYTDKLLPLKVARSVNVLTQLLVRSIKHRRSRPILLRNNNPPRRRRNSARCRSLPRRCR